MDPDKVISFATAIREQGELAVGTNTTRIKTSTYECSRIWVGAPTANHTGGTNSGNILVGNNATSNAAGGIALEADNYLGFYVHCIDASEIYFTGFNAGDVVEYQIFW
jgi:hypothetical protein